MDSFSDAFRHRVLSLGQIAANMIHEPAEASVEAVFRSTFYLKSGGQILCLGHEDMEPGPLNCITSAPATIDWRASGLECAAKARISSNAVRVGNTFRFSLSNAQVWGPGRRGLPDHGELMQGVAAYRRAISRRGHIDGFGRFLIPGYQPKPCDHVCLRAEGPLFASGQWLTKAFRTPDFEPVDEPGWVEKLSGLGPGLTPSGDDFIGGMMIALHSLDKGNLSKVLWLIVKRYAGQHCNPISLAHLSAASNGLGCAVIHRALAAVSKGRIDGIDTAIGDVSKIGHSSGWDIMTGIILTLEAWLKVQTEIRRV